ncbi:MAG: S-layer homology domain-containing protein [Clostridiales bacterium]|nr:S-layer homology domain-containing protein [Clostridiales bacterium]
MQVLNKLGIINGVGAGAIDPQGKATRAQVAAMLHRFAEAVH